MDEIIVKIKNLSPHKNPDYATAGSAGVDLIAWVDKEIAIEPLERKLIPTGIYLEIPEGFEAQVRPRSGLALKHGITVLNTPGTIDSDYRGEIGVILINLSDKTFIVQNGDRIAQLVFSPYSKVKFISSDRIDETFRGEGGFGHTGI